MPPQPPPAPMKTNTWIWAVVIGIVVIIGAYLLLTNVPVVMAPSTTGSNSTTTTTTTGTGTVGRPPLPLHTFTDSKNHFSFTYPYAFSVGSTISGQTPSWMYNTTINGTLYAAILVPQNFMPKTNFNDARFTVGSSAVAAAVTSCTQKMQGETAQGTVVIHGTTFYKFLGNDAGAGNLYQTTSYRTVHGGACWAVEYTIHSGNFANYPTGTVSQFNTAVITAPLEAMAASFKFI